MRGEVGFSEEENGLRILGIDGNCGLEITNLVGGAAGNNPADEVFKGVQTDGGRALKEGLARLGEGRTNLAKDIPGERGLDADEVVQGAALNLVGREAKSLHIQNLGAGGEGLTVVGVAAENDVVGIELGGNAIEGGTRGMEIDGDSHAVKGVLAVVTADEKQRLGVEPLAENLREGFADPLQTGLVGGVVKGKHENGLSARCSLGEGHDREQKQEREKSRKPVRFQGSTIIYSQRAGPPLECAGLAPTYPRWSCLRTFAQREAGPLLACLCKSCSMSSRMRNIPPPFTNIASAPAFRQSVNGIGNAESMTTTVRLVVDFAWRTTSKPEVSVSIRISVTTRSKESCAIVLIASPADTAVETSKFRV